MPEVRTALLMLLMATTTLGGLLLINQRNSTLKNRPPVATQTQVQYAR